MKNLFIPYELSVLAKQKGFNEPCFSFYYDNNFEFWKEQDVLKSIEFPFDTVSCNAPLYQQIVDWFREKHNHVIMIKKDWHKGKLMGWECVIEQKDGFIDCGTFKTHNAALNKAIEETFKLI